MARRLFGNQLWKNFKSFKFRSLIIKNFVLIFLVVMVPILTITYTVQKKYNQSVIDEIETANYNSVRRVKETVDRVFNESTRLAAYLSISRNYELYFEASESFVNTYDFF